jgi:transforming growth factor-beta-induced protein
MRTRPTRRRAIAVIVALGAITAVAPRMTEAHDASSAAGFRSAPTAAPSGPACADVPADGEGSFAGMADDPGGTAAANNPELSTLVAAVDAAGLTDTLNGEGPFTIFAPDNAAFEKIPTNVLDSILADAELLTSILTYHVVGDEALDSAALAEGGTATTVNGSELQFALDGDSLMINGDEAVVVCADIPVANGVVHIIDTVLQPPSDDVSLLGSSVPSSGPGALGPDVTAVATPGDGPQGPLCATLPVDGEGSIEGMADDPAATAASNNPELSTLVAAITAAGLTDTLNGEGPFTIFAPANSAFEEIPAADLEAIMADTEQLTSILGFHVIEGEALTAADLAAAGTGVTVQGSELTFSAEADGSLSINAGEATVACSNIVVGNAIVHIIDSVLVPPAE